MGNCLSVNNLFFFLLQLEDAGAEVCDALYEDFGDLLGMSSLEEGDMCYKTYILVTIKILLILLSQDSALVSVGYGQQQLHQCWVHKRWSPFQERKLEGDLTL